MDIKNLREKIEFRWMRNSQKTLYFGIILSVLGMLILIGIFYPAILAEIKYSFYPKETKWEVIAKNEVSEDKNEEVKKIIPVDENFGIVIPKIEANAKVIPEVDSQNSDIYQRALTQGVAHAKGTALPGENGNIFIFAHSGADLLEANRYNAVFYLLSKLEKGDKIYIFYQGNKYVFDVFDIKKVDANEVSYLDSNKDENKLTLMTCWPPGTTLKRLVVIAKLNDSGL